MEVLIHWERKQNGSSFFSDLLELKKRLWYHLIPPTDFAREESDTWSIQSHRVSSQMSLDCAWGFCWLPLSHSAFPVWPTAMLATTHRTGTGSSRKCQTARWLGCEVHSQLMTPREVYLSFQSCFLCFIFSSSSELSGEECLKSRRGVPSSPSFPPLFFSWSWVHRRCTEWCPCWVYKAPFWFN